MNLTCRSSPLPPKQSTVVHPRVLHLNLSSMLFFPYTFTLNHIHKLSPLHSIMHIQSCLFKALLTPSICNLFGLPLPHLLSTPYFFSDIQTPHLCPYKTVSTIILSYIIRFTFIPRDLTLHTLLVAPATFTAYSPYSIHLPQSLHSCLQLLPDT